MVGRQTSTMNWERNIGHCVSLFTSGHLPFNDKKTEMDFMDGNICFSVWRMPIILTNLISRAGNNIFNLFFCRLVSPQFHFIREYSTIAFLAIHTKSEVMITPGFYRCI